MRIVAGDLRRRKLMVNPGNTTRPITDRAKVKLFDYIRGYMPGRRVIDIFAGTGSLGFEALSRGATSVVFCEQDHRAHELLVQNAAHLGVSEKTLCWRVDCLRCSFKAQGEQGWYPYGVIFFDPPYVMIKDLKEGSPLYRALERLSRPELSTDSAMLVLRTPSESRFHLPPAWLLERVVSMGSMDIHILHKQPGQFETSSAEQEDLIEQTKAIVAPSA